MILDRLAWFAMGATVALTLCGWLWHHRFSRYKPRHRQSLPPQGDWLDEAFPLPPPDVMAAINRQLDRAIAAEMARRGSNPPPPGRKPAQPAGPPCNGGEITLAQWEAMRTHFTEGLVQRGQGNGGPSTEKPWE
jgi:hypothetical protein